MRVFNTSERFGAFRAIEPKINLKTEDLVPLQLYE